MKYYKANNTIYAYDEEQVAIGLADDKTELTAGELELHINPPVVIIIPSSVTMRQARLALLQAGLLTTVDTAIANGTDEAMKIEWEYTTSIERDWSSLITLTTAIGMTSEQLDDLFLLASTL